MWSVIAAAQDTEGVVVGLKEIGVEPSRRSRGDDGGGAPEELDMLVDPGLFRQVDELVRSRTEGRGSLQVVELNVQQEGKLLCLFLQIEQMIYISMWWLDSLLVCAGEADVDLEIARKEKMKREEEEIAALAAAVRKQAEIDEGGEEKEEEEDHGHKQGKGRPDDEEDEGGVRIKGGAGKKSKAAKRREKEDKKERELLKQQAAEKRAASQPERADEQRPSSFSTTTTKSAPVAAGAEGGGKRFVCNTCRVDFADIKDYREHYRTDWHRYNLKLKEKGGGAVSEKEFQLCDADELFFTGGR